MSDQSKKYRATYKLSDCTATATFGLCPHGEYWREERARGKGYAHCLRTLPPCMSAPPPDRQCGECDGTAQLREELHRRAADLELASDIGG